jgi:hypothetical protein
MKKRERDYKELAHAIMEAEKFHICHLPAG